MICSNGEHSRSAANFAPRSNERTDGVAESIQINDARGALEMDRRAVAELIRAQQTDVWRSAELR